MQRVERNIAYETGLCFISKEKWLIKKYGQRIKKTWDDKGIESAQLILQKLLQSFELMSQAIKFHIPCRKIDRFNKEDSKFRFFEFNRSS